MPRAGLELGTTGLRDRRSDHSTMLPPIIVHEYSAQIVCRIDQHEAGDGVCKIGLEQLCFVSPKEAETLLHVQVKGE